MSDKVIELTIEECGLVAGGDGGLVWFGSGTRSDTGDDGGSSSTSGG
ncbi:MAG TPA: hypothetical protein VNT25_00880 [Allosphingosinicella sp.]|nr:hypothetical protein [Allosphingosinicella sp.]